MNAPADPPPPPDAPIPPLPSETPADGTGQLMRLACQKAQLGGWQVDLLQQRIHWSDEVCATHDVPPGYSPTLEEAMAFYAPEWRNKLRSLFDRCISGGEPFDVSMEILTAKGRRRWVRAIGEAVRSPSGTILGARGAFQDLTEIKRFETYRLLCGRVMAILGRSESFADSVREILAAVKQASGCDAVGLRLRNGDDFPFIAHEGFSPAFVLAENSLLERDEKGDVCRNPDGSPQLECTCGLVLQGKTDPANPLFTPGGSAWTNDSFPLLEVPPDLDPRPNPRNRCIHEGYASVALVPVRHRGEIVGILQLNGKPRGLFSLPAVEALEEVAAHLGEALRRKEDAAERERLQTQLHQAHLLENVGQLAAGIAHEINTPIQFVGDNLRFLQDGFDDLLRLVQASAELVRELAGPSSDAPRRLADAEAAADLDYLRNEVPKALAQSAEGVRRVSKIVRAMKEFSHPGGGEKSRADLNRAIETTLTIARNEWKYDAEVETHLDPALPTVLCWPGEINQVVLNLVVNAAHAIREAMTARGGGKGLISISTSYAPPFAEIRVADNGTGIPEHVRPHVFAPFFTTKGVGKGTGQGLAMAYNAIVKKHGGSIHFESTPGQGTTFVVRIPVDSDAQPQETP
jgi:PAS domain S-box-containing protein